MNWTWIKRLLWAVVGLTSLLLIVAYALAQRGDPSIPAPQAIGREVSGSELRARLAVMRGWSAEEIIRKRLIMIRFNGMPNAARAEILDVYEQIRKAPDSASLKEMARRYSTYYGSLSIKEKNEFDAIADEEEKLARIHRDLNKPPARLSWQDNAVLREWCLTFVRQRLQNQREQAASMFREFKKLRRQAFGDRASPASKPQVSPLATEPSAPDREGQERHFLDDRQVLGLLHYALALQFEPKERPDSMRRVPEGLSESFQNYARLIIPQRSDIPLQELTEKGLSKQVLRSLASFPDDSAFQKALVNWLYSIRFPGKSFSMADLQQSFDALPEAKKREYLLMPKQDMQDKLLFGDDYEPADTEQLESLGYLDLFPGEQLPVRKAREKD